MVSALEIPNSFQIIIIWILKYKGFACQILIIILFIVTMNFHIINDNDWIFQDGKCWMIPSEIFTASFWNHHSCNLNIECFWGSNGPSPSCLYLLLWWLGGILQENLFNIMTSDALAPCVAKASAVMVLTLWQKWAPVFHKKDFQLLLHHLKWYKM